MEQHLPHAVVIDVREDGLLMLKPVGGAGGRPAAHAGLVLVEAVILV